MLAFGIGMIALGGYHLKYYYDKSQFIKLHGKAAWPEEKLYGTSKIRLVDALLYNTWWAPLGFVILGSATVYIAFTDKEKE